VDVAWVVCPKCEGRFCVGAEYRAKPTMLCHCPKCAEEFTFEARLPTASDVSTAEVSPWV
jgi:hypothetical protein